MSIECRHCGNKVHDTDCPNHQNNENAIDISYLKYLISQLDVWGFWAELACSADKPVPKSKDDYLLRYGRDVDFAQNLVLMGDLGITWEPARAYPTEKLGSIVGKNSTIDVALMVKTANEYYAQVKEKVGEKMSKKSNNTLIVAQGGGFYGCAFFTTNKSIDEVREILKDHHLFAEGDEGFGIIHDGTSVFIRGSNWSGQPQPNPVLLFDTGRGDKNIQALWYMKGLLGE